MSLRNVIALNAMVACIFGVAFVFFPGFMMSAYGVTQNPEGWALTRLLGTTLITFGLVMWCVKDGAMSATRRAVTLALLSANVIGLLITVIQQQAIWSVNSRLVGWLTVSVYLAFVVAYGYLAIKAPTSTARLA